MDLYDDLDDFVDNYEDLLKIHTGHQNQSPDDEDLYDKHDSDTKSEKSEEDYWPTLFNPEHIKAKLVNAKDIPVEEESTDKVQMNPKFLTVAKTLKNLITKKFCHICNRHASGHYMAACHYKKVLEWITQNTKTSDPNVLKTIYCAACNTGLDKNDSHYSTESHQRNLAYYCDICKSKFTLPINQGHLQSKRHKLNLPDINPIHFTVPSAEYASHQAMAKYLQSLLTFTKCLVCNTSIDINRKHYTSKKHIKKVQGWIQENSTIYGLALKNSEQLYCTLCNDVFTSEDIAQIHYQSQKHNDNMSLYCSSCQILVKDMDLHITKNSHKRRVYGSSRRSKRITDRNKSWPKELTYMITLVNCDVCSLKLESYHDAYKHYMSDGHNANVAAWIANPETRKQAAESCISTAEENSEQSILRSTILQEVKNIIDKLYYSKSIPLRDALEHLKRLNREIADICNNCKNDAEPIMCEPPPKPRISTDDSSVQFTNFKLYMELERLKMVLQKVDLIPPELSLRYASNLVQMMKSLTNGQHNIHSIEINKIFDVLPSDLIECDIQYKTRFQEELNSLEYIITCGNSKIDSETALDVITQFNVHLESLLDRDCDDNSCSSDDDSSITD